MASIFGEKCKCNDCKHEFPDHHLVDAGSGENGDIVWVCPNCGSRNWDYAK